MGRRMGRWPFRMYISPCGSVMNSCRRCRTETALDFALLTDEIRSAQKSAGTALCREEASKGSKRGKRIKSDGFRRVRKDHAEYSTMDNQEALKKSRVTLTVEALPKIK